MAKSKNRNKDRNTEKRSRKAVPKAADFDAREAFERGRHREVVARVAPPGTDSSEAMALIASLAFLGRLDEAIAFWRSAGEGLSPSERARARFAIGIQLARTSRFRVARRYLSENATDQECRGCPDVSQGIGIYYYYRGEFKKASLHGRRALRLALKNGDNYMRALATDLVGHALCQIGRRSVGARMLSQARALTGMTGEADAFSTERLIYEARDGLRPETIVDEIRESIAKHGADNTYTKANLTLELARQLILRGRWEESRHLLDAEAGNIYAFENRRQEATLQLRLAELSYRRGDGVGAMHFLQGARRCIDAVADRSFEIRILGLERKVETRLLGHESAAAHRERFEELSRDSASPMNARILNREKGDVAKVLAHGEDPLGDLLDLVAIDRVRAASELLKAGYLGLWPEAIGLPPGDERLFVFASGEWIGVRRTGVTRSAAPLSQTSRKILLTLSKGLLSKERLLAVVWGYDYDPIRHDAMIYTALTALRKSLGSMAGWLQTHDNGWSAGPCEFLTSESVRITIAPAARSAADIEKNSRFSAERHLDLNLRQLKALDEMARNHEGKAVLTAPVYAGQFNVSLMTAWRDLDDLVKKRYLVRTGFGRSTSYRKGEMFP